MFEGVIIGFNADSGFTDVLNGDTNSNAVFVLTHSHSACGQVKVGFAEITS